MKTIINTYPQIRIPRIVISLSEQANFDQPKLVDKSNFTILKFH